MLALVECLHLLREHPVLELGLLGLVQLALQLALEPVLQIVLGHRFARPLAGTAPGRTAHLAPSPVVPQHGIFTYGIIFTPLHAPRHATRVPCGSAATSAEGSVTKAWGARPLAEQGTDECRGGDQRERERPAHGEAAQAGRPRRALGAGAGGGRALRPVPRAPGRVPCPRGAREGGAPPAR